MRNMQVENLIILGEATVSIDEILIAFGVSGVMVQGSCVSKYRYLDRAQRLYVAMDRLKSLEGEAARATVQELVSRPNTYAVVKASDIADSGLLAWLDAQDRVLLVKQEESSEPEERAATSRRQPYFDAAFLTKAVPALVGEGGQADLHDFDYEFREMDREDRLASVRMIHAIRTAEIYLMSNVMPTSASLKSIYVERPAARFFWQPEISIIMPTWNSMAFIEHTLISITLQEGENYEVVVIDDGSSDDTVAFVRDYAMTDDRVQLYTQANAGPQVARNRGLDRAKGKYVTFLDHDDIMLTDSLRRRLDVLAKKEFLMCGGRVEIVNPDGELVGLTIGRQVPTYYRDCHNMPVHIDTLTGRSDVIKRFRFPLIKGYADDWTYVSSMLREGWTIGTCGAEPLVAYRWHRASLTGSGVDKHFFNCMQVLRDLSIRQTEDLGLIEKPQGSMDLAERLIETQRVIRIQSEFYSLALRQDEMHGEEAEALLAIIVGMMNGIAYATKETLQESFFKSVGSKILVGHPDNTAFMKGVMEHWYWAVELCDRLAVTPANARYVENLTSYLSGVRERLAERNVPVPAASLMEKVFGSAKERFKPAG